MLEISLLVKTGSEYLRVLYIVSMNMQVLYQCILNTHKY
uniref:Uncharacterized protein n=1 Tax=Lepeophtheirus salmonis TaxID=72036 RepID=A0A0K2VLH1_LEPSM